MHLRYLKTLNIIFINFTFNLKVILLYSSPTITHARVYSNSNISKLFDICENIKYQNDLKTISVLTKRIDHTTHTDLSLILVFRL